MAVQYKRIGKAINVISRLSPSLANRLSFRLFTTPRPRPIKPAERDFLARARQEDLQVGPHRIRWYRWGKAGAPRVLFAHGWESNAGRWRSFIPPLLDGGYEAIAFDAPAHGQSSGKRLHLIMYMQSLRALVARVGPVMGYVGHSMGGGAGILSFAEHGTVLGPKKMVILGAFATVHEVYDRYAGMLGLAPRLKPVFDAHIRRLSGGKGLADFNVEEKVRLLHDVSGLVIHDKDDKSVPFAEGKRIAEAWPGARFLPTKGAGHSLQTPEIHRAVADFIMG